MGFARLPNYVIDRQRFTNLLEWRKLVNVKFRRRPCRRKLETLADDISRYAADANTLIADTEPDFVALARDLSDLYTCATELGHSTDQQVISLQDTIGETRLIGSDGLAGLLLAGLRSAITEMEVELKALSRICSELVRLVHLGGRIGLTAVFLNTARYSFRVESARTEATRQSFGAFTEELEPLANRVGVVGETIATGARHAQLELQDLIRAIGNDSDRLREVIAATGTAVEETCRRGQGLLDSCFGALQESGKRAGERDRHAGEAVYHVQFGDIVRQKVEHVAAALAETAAAIKKPDSRDSALAQADHVLAIQQAQIDLITSEIRSVQQGLGGAFTGLSDETDALAASMSELGGGAVFEELTKRLRELGDLESRGRAMREQSRASWTRALETSREGARQMDLLREINFRMHLQSLNAIIKTEWLGEQGLTLGVLSSDMHRVFQESTDLVAETAGVLESISNQTENSSDSANGKAGTEGADLNASLEDGLRSVSRVREEFQRTVEAAREMAMRQSSQLAQAQRSLGFLDSLARKLENLAGEIGHLRDAITPLLGDAAGAARDPLSLAERYTMESEREVHRRQQDPEDAEPVAASQSSELGDNVDFF